MCPESSPHVLALGNITTGIPRCVLQELAALCRTQGAWRDRALGVVLRGSLCQPARPRGKGQTLIQAGEPPGDVDLCPVLEGAFLVRSIGAVRGS